MFQASVDVPCPSLLALPVMKQWDLDICAGKGVIRIHTFGVTIPFEDGLPYIDIFDATESGINGPIPTVFKRTFEEQIVVKQCLNSCRKLLMILRRRNQTVL